MVTKVPKTEFSRSVYLKRIPRNSGQIRLVQQNTSPWRRTLNIILDMRREGEGVNLLGWQCWNQFS